jgi:hypothetical protein
MTLSSERRRRIRQELIPELVAQLMNNSELTTSCVLIEIKRVLGGRKCALALGSAATRKNQWLVEVEYNGRYDKPWRLQFRLQHSICIHLDRLRIDQDLLWCVDEEWPSCQRFSGTYGAQASKLTQYFLEVCLKRSKSSALLSWEDRNNWDADDAFPDLELVLWRDLEGTRWFAIDWNSLPGGPRTTNGR